MSIDLYTAPFDQHYVPMTEVSQLQSLAVSLPPFDSDTAISAARTNSPAYLASIQELASLPAFFRDLGDTFEYSIAGEPVSAGTLSLKSIRIFNSIQVFGDLSAEVLEEISELETTIKGLQQSASDNSKEHRLKIVHLQSKVRELYSSRPLLETKEAPKRMVSANEELLLRAQIKASTIGKGSINEEYWLVIPNEYRPVLRTLLDRENKTETRYPLLSNTASFVGFKASINGQPFREVLFLQFIYAD